MRRIRCGSAVITLGVVLTHQWGCVYSRAGDCEGNLECDAKASDGAIVETPADCVPRDAGGPVAGSCGIFVSSSLGSDANDGSKDKPFKTLSAAIAKAEAVGKPVYACAETFTDAVTITRGIDVFGALDCAKDWSYDGAAKTALVGASDAIPLFLSGAAKGATVADFRVQAADATKAGGSSIAVIAEDAPMELVRCEVIAGNGADGAVGKTPAVMAAKGADAPAPDPTTMNACINLASVLGGAPGVTSCEDGVSKGGVGGKGGLPASMDGNGQSGADGEVANGVDGLGGEGMTATSNCKDGSRGRDGSPGLAGGGGAALGVLSSTGISGGEGETGATGERGQGGGGGGGARAGVFCPAGPMTVEGPGASGGGGGAGGCGGRGGAGGQAGGSSIGIISLGSSLVLTDVMIATAKGGKGGNGDVGRSGAIGGMGGQGGAKSGLSGSKPGCKGGGGGTGGDGGTGGGGRGGHSIAVAYAITPMMPLLMKDVMVGTPGEGGLGGFGAPATSQGAVGMASACWNFSASAPCAP